MTLRHALIAAVVVLVSSTASAYPLPVEVRRGPVVVRAEAGLHRYAADMAKVAANVYGPIHADLHGLPVPSRIELRLVREVTDLGSAAPPGARVPTWAAGIAFPRQGVVVVALRKRGQPLPYLNTTAHEIAHLLLGAALGHNVPRWLHEGFADLHSPEMSLERTRTLIGMAWTGGGASLHELDSKFPEQEIAAHKAYAQAHDVVAFLARRGRFPGNDDDGSRLAFRRFLRGLAAGMSVNEAALDAYSATLSNLEEEWRTDLRGRLMIAPVGTCSLGIWGFGAVLLILGYIRKRRHNRRTIDRWDEEDAYRRAMAEADAASDDEPMLH